MDIFCRLPAPAIYAAAKQDVRALNHRSRRRYYVSTMDEQFQRTNTYKSIGILNSGVAVHSSEPFHLAQQEIIRPYDLRGFLFLSGFGPAKNDRHN
jgi:hypothetical protein